MVSPRSFLRLATSLSVTARAFIPTPSFQYLLRPPVAVAQQIHAFNRCPSCLLSVNHYSSTSSSGLRVSSSRRHQRDTLTSRQQCLLPHAQSCFRSSNSVMRMSTSSAGPETQDTVVRAAHILVENEEQADLAVARLKNGETFDAVAQDMSSCPSKEKGGDLGWFGRGQMVPEFEEVVYDPENPAGSMVICQTQFGYHVVAILAKANPPQQMSPTELGEILEKIKADSSLASEYQLLDVREKDEEQKAKVEGFTLYPLSEFEDWGVKVQEGTLLEKGKKTIIMCHAGMRSMKVAQFLAMMQGFADVHNLEGGIAAYAQTVDSSVGQY